MYKRMNAGQIRHMATNIIGSKDVPDMEDATTGDVTAGKSAGDRGLVVPAGHHVSRMSIEPVADADGSDAYMVEHHFDRDAAHKPGAAEPSFHSPHKSVVTKSHPAHGAIKSMFSGPAKAAGYGK